MRVVDNVKIKIPSGRCFRVNWFGSMRVFMLGYAPFSVYNAIHLCVFRVLAFSLWMCYLNTCNSYAFVLSLWGIFSVVVSTIVGVFVVGCCSYCYYSPVANISLSSFWLFANLFVASWVATCLSHLFISAKQKTKTHTHTLWAKKEDK